MKTTAKLEFHVTELAALEYACRRMIFARQMQLDTGRIPNIERLSIKNDIKLYEGLARALEEAQR